MHTAIQTNLRMIYYYPWNEHSVIEILNLIQK